MCARVCARVYVRACVRVCVHVHVCACPPKSMWIRNTCRGVSACVCVCVCVSACVCVTVCMHVGRDGSMEEAFCVAMCGGGWSV